VQNVPRPPEWLFMPILESSYLINKIITPIKEKTIQIERHLMSGATYFVSQIESPERKTVQPLKRIRKKQEELTSLE
jgi:hypothetical protein